MLERPSHDKSISNDKNNRHSVYKSISNEKKIN